MLRCAIAYSMFRFIVSVFRFQQQNGPKRVFKVHAVAFEKEIEGVTPVSRNRKVAFFYDIDSVNPSGRNFRALLSTCSYAPLSDVAKWVDERCRRLRTTIEDLQEEDVEAGEDMDAVPDHPRDHPDQNESRDEHG